MTRTSKARSNSVPFQSLPRQTRVASIRYSLNWQGTALRLQYGRLKAHVISPDDLAESAIREYMSGVIDMDLFVIVVRRILRMARQARGSGLDLSGSLKPLIKDFELHWAHVVDARDTLEHIDEPKAFRALTPTHSSNGDWTFLMPGKSVDIHQLFKDTEDLCRAIGKVIEPYESEVDDLQMGASGNS